MKMDESMSDLWPEFAKTSHYVRILQVLGVFANLQKAAFSFFMPFSQSV
jgi:hypothetical protein